MSSVGRNEPCPCGSGKRYKECHGTLEGDGEPASPVPNEVIGPALQAALAAQQQGRLEEARRLYSEVLALAPSHFDAIHMLGVVYSQLGLFEDARRCLDKAAVLQPGVAAVKWNHDLVDITEEHVVLGRAMCQEVLPRLASLCAPPDEFRAWLGSAGAVHVVSHGEDEAIVAEAVRSLRVLCAPTQVQRWSDLPEGRLAGDWKMLEPAKDVLPQGGLLVTCASARTVVHWIAAAEPDRVALLVTAAEPGHVIDRLRELTLEGRRRATVLYAAPGLQPGMGLPGMILQAAPVGAAA